MSPKAANRVFALLSFVLILIITILIYAIINRPHYILGSSENDSNLSNSISMEIEPSSIIEEVSSQVSDKTSNEVKLQKGKTSTRVNIRELPDANSRKLETVEAGYEFNILEIRLDGWTKIEYQNVSAYISSQYVILIQ